MLRSPVKKSALSDLEAELANREERISRLLSLLADTQVPLALMTKDTQRLGIGPAVKMIAADVLAKVKEALDEC